MVRIITSKTLDLSRRVEDEDVMRGLSEDQIGDEALSIKVPSLYVVLQKNPYIRPGRYVRRFDDGYEECIVDSPNGRLRVVGYRGPVYPHSVLSPFLLAVRRTGFDSGSARMDRRREMEQVGG